MIEEQLRFVVTNLPNLILGFPGHRPGGLLMSLFLACLGVGIGFCLALIVGSSTLSQKRPIRWLARTYIHIFRGIPIVLLVLLLHQILANGRRYGLNFTPLHAALLALSLYSSAYQAEVVRAGLMTIPENLPKAAAMLGAKPWYTFRSIEIPYSLRLMLPAFIGEAISLFKDTSVVIIIGVADLVTVGNIVLGSNVENAPFWMSITSTIGLLYFCVAFTISRLAYRWEKQNQLKDLTHSLANY